MINEEAVNRVKIFIQKIEDGDLEFTQNATDAKFGIPTSSIIYGNRTKDRTSLSDELARCLATFRSNVFSDDNVSSMMINDCLTWINQAYMTRSVKPSEGIFRKYNESLEENEKLKQDNAEIFAELQSKIAEYSELQGRYKELNEKIARYFPLKDTS